ncbi:MAG: hypothetical protein EBU08_13665 [Micrococcales bacterium]|nr:hypothetical protein [Micrococcales bacterium]
MANNAKNIIVGAGIVYIGKTAGVEYNENDIPAAATTRVATSASSLNDGRLAGANTINTFDNPDLVNANNFTHVGYTSEGVTFDFSPDYGEVQVDQLLDVAKIFKQGQTVMVKTTFTEATLENFLVTLGGDSTDLSSTSSSGSGTIRSLTLNGGSLGYSPIERSLLVVGPAPDAIRPATAQKAERLYVGYRAVSMETVSIGIKRNEATVFPVTFRLLPSDTYRGVASSGAEATYGKIIDRVYTPA